MADDENAVSDSKSRTCPYCREKVHPQAMRCKHCQTWLTGEEEQPTGGFKTTQGPWTVTDMGPADEGTVLPLVEKSCGDCHSESGFWGRLGGLSGHGVRTCKIRHCYIADNRIHCIDIPFKEDCELPGLFQRLANAVVGA
jgi:hypothetical protein